MQHEECLTGFVRADGRCWWQVGPVTVLMFKTTQKHELKMSTFRSGLYTMHMVRHELGASKWFHSHFRARSARQALEKEFLFNCR